MWKLACICLIKPFFFHLDIALAIIVGVIVGGSSILLLGIAVTMYKKKMAKKTLLEYDYQMQEHTYE